MIPFLLVPCTHNVRFILLRSALDTSSPSSSFLIEMAWAEASWWYRARASPAQPRESERDSPLKSESEHGAHGADVKYMTTF